jgi:HD superfamily phosphohydrolase
VELEKCKTSLEKCKDEDKPINSLKKDQLEQKLDRLSNLRNWHDKFVKEGKFHPFMSDIIANTICADLLDYLPRDRMNLGMEYRQHDRIQRFFTIRPGSLYSNEDYDEGLRLSILVTRTQKGGQRPDVATAVLRIMRERYEMAERVYYHHKKAAFSSMLAKLVEICNKPLDSENVYPAPWTSDICESHVLHFTDSSLIDYLGKLPIPTEFGWLQRKLYLGIKYKRKDVYRTLLVIDTDLVQASHYTVGYFAKDLRGKQRKDIESILASAAGVRNGEVLIYCPDSKMQSKEVDARLEIITNQIHPLSTQQKLFAYSEDVRVLQQYYKELWRSYIFVSKEIFEDRKKCKIIVDKFCEIYNIKQVVAYQKVRKYGFDSDEETVIKVMEPIHQFLYNPDNGGLPFNDTPTPIIASFFKKAMQRYDEIKSDNDPSKMLTSLFIVATLENCSDGLTDEASKNSINKYLHEVSDGQRTFPLQRAKEPYKRFEEFKEALLIAVLGPPEDTH